MIRITLAFTLIGITTFLFSQNVSEGFVDLGTLEGVFVEVRYYSSDNFVGKKIDGYLAPKAYLSKEAAMALVYVIDDLGGQGLGLKVFDAYRPQKAVDHFVRWAGVTGDTLTKSKYYPDVDKKDVFKLGYVASKSGHSRGSTVDLTLIWLETGEEVDMGSGWDFFGKISAHGIRRITEEQFANRLLLRETMERHGFKAYREEWWHYTLKGEPYPNTYFDFDVK